VKKPGQETRTSTTQPTIQSQATPQTTQQASDAQRKLTEAQEKLVQLYLQWRESLSYYDIGDLYRMQFDLQTAIVEEETSDLQDQIDELRVALNESRDRLKMPLLKDPIEEEEGVEGEGQ
jgi:hypothetical protein